MGTVEKNDSEQKVIYHLSLRPQNYADLEESFQWYSNQKNNLGQEFLKQIESCVERISCHDWYSERSEGHQHADTLDRS